MLVADPSSPFCPEHARSAVNFRRAADLSTLLTEGITEFKSATPINDFLSRLLLHQAEGRIPPRRAAVMAYTCNLLLRTLPAIEHELHPPSQKDQEDSTIIMDIPSAVAERARLAQRLQDPDRAFYERMATRYGSRPTPVDSDVLGALSSETVVSPTESPK
jgi:hypothetical protein